MWAITILSLLGVVLNIYKRKECFVIWSVTNLSWAIYNWHIRAYEQATLFIVYFALAVWGLVKWRN